MKRSLVASGLGLLAVILIAQPAWAISQNDYQKVVTSALSSASVYVDPATGDTNSTTASQLASKLTADDTIVLILLPADASSVITDPNEFLRSVDDSLGKSAVIGLTIGSSGYAYSKYLPSGVANDQMNRAESVSTNNVETMGTFVRNMHAWQVQHPQVVPNDSVAGVSLTPVIIYGLSGFLLTAVVTTLVRRRRRKIISSDYVKLTSATPETVRRRIEDLLNKRPKIESSAMRDVLTQICKDIELYFKKSSETSQVRSDAYTFELHLNKLKEITDRYIEVQDTPRAYDEPDEIMRLGLCSLQDFSVFVIGQVRRGTRSQLTSYGVNTDILSAQRYR